MVGASRTTSPSAMMQRALLSCALVALALLAWRGAAPSASPSGGGRSLLLQAHAAKLPDCCCELETIDMGNDEELYQKLQKLRVRDAAMHWAASLLLHRTRAAAAQLPRQPTNASPTRLNCIALLMPALLAQTFTFFRIFKVNLHSECPFWRDNAKCSRRNCAVCDECPNESVRRTQRQRGEGQRWTGLGWAAAATPMAHWS